MHSEEHFFLIRFVWETVFQARFQVHTEVESASAESRITEQIMQTKIMGIYGSSQYK